MAQKAKPTPRLPVGAAVASTIIPGLSSTATISAPPTIIQPPVSQAQEQKPGWGKNIKPPSMVLDEDVNGFRSKKSKSKRSEKKGKYKKACFCHTCCPPGLMCFLRTRISLSSYGIPLNNTILDDPMITTNIRPSSKESAKKNDSGMPSNEG